MRSIATIVFMMFMSGTVFGQYYVLTEIKPLEGETKAFAYDINDFGQIVGESNNRPVIWDLLGNATELSRLPDGRFSEAISINNLGQITGHSTLPYNRELGTRNRITLWEDDNVSIVVDVDPDDSRNRYSGIKISDSGYIAGAGFGESNGRALRWSESEGMESLSAGPAKVYDLNEVGDILGSENGEGRVWRKDGSSVALRDLTGAVSSMAIPQVFGKNGSIVGLASDSSGTTQPVLWNQNSDGSYANPVQFGRINSGYMQVTAANDDVVLGYSNNVAVVWDYEGNAQRLSSLSTNNTGVTLDLDYPLGINKIGQIVGWGSRSGPSYSAFLATLVSDAPSLYEVVDPVAPISRLGRWDGSDFVPVAPGEIQDGDSVHVVTHGWKPGYLQAVEDNPGLHVWDAAAVNGDGERADMWMFDMARMMSEQDPGSKVYAFSWIDKSATSELSASDLGSLRYAALSQSHTEASGDVLRDALMDTLSDAWDGQLHLLGHSHGSKVVTEAALGLEGSGVDVSGLTVLDSPETGVTLGGIASLFTGGSNNIENKLRELAVLSPETFIDSYYSKFGEAYGLSGVVDVFIQAEHLADIAFDVSGRHAYPIDWYIAASEQTSDLALHWMDVMPDEDHYIQDWLLDDDVDSSRELVLSPYNPTILDNPLVENGIKLVELASEGVVGLAFDALGRQIVRLTENSPSYFHSLVVFEEGDINLLLDYEFVQAGDGDEFGIWIDGEQLLILSGLFADSEGTAVLDISGFDPGVHVLTFALHSYGDANAEFLVGNLRTQSLSQSIPEPTSILILGLMLLGTVRRR